MAAARCAVVRRARRCLSGSPTAPSCSSTGWSPRLPRGARPGSRAGCGWSRSCTCRWARARRMTASGSGRGRCSRPPPRSSPRARGPGERSSSSTTLAGRPRPRRRARSRRRRARAGHGDGRGAALGRGGDPRQGPRRAGRRARDADGPSLAVPVRRAAWSATRPSSSACAAASSTGGMDGRVRFSGPQAGARSRPQLQRGGCPRAAVARGDVRDGRHRGAGPRPAGRRRRRRRRAGGAGSRRRRRPAGLARPSRRCGGARRRAASLARGRRTCAGGCGGRRASGASRSPAGRRPISVVAGVLAGAAG